MKRLVHLLFFLVTLCPVIANRPSNEQNFPSHGNSQVSVDSILSKVIQFAPLYESAVEEFRADLYMKGKLYIRKKNLLFRYAPFMFKQKKGTKEYLTEFFSELHYTAPNIYDQKIKATYGTLERFKGIGVDVIDYFHINIYSTSLLSAKLLSPLSPNARKYYKFKIDSLQSNTNETVYRISFTPKNKSYQLVKGYMLVSDNVWSIREFQFSGRSEYFRFDNLIKMGDVGEDNEFLPVKYNMNGTFRLLGNKVDGNFTGVFDYNNIKFAERKKAGTSGKKKRKYDMTESFSLQCDTTTCMETDSAAFAQLRPLPLTEYEQKIYNENSGPKDSVISSMLQKPTKIFWKEVGEIGEALISDHSLRFNDGTYIKISPIINPFVIDYSGRNGFSYRYDFRYNRAFKGDRLLRIAPRVGYNFKYHEFYWRVHADFDYWPRKHASLHLRVGNGNRIYSSDVLNKLYENPDSVVDFNKLKLNYYRDLHFDLRHRMEVINGLSIDVGVAIHRRSATEKENLPEGDTSNEDPTPDDNLKRVYVSFAPRVKISWTPHQYYYMNGDRKVNLYSKWPTFSVDWERGIKGVINSCGEYERFEFDMQHQISLGLMRSLYYRVGCGAFTDQEQLYFVDFANFTRNNLPVGWNDEIGGVFQELDRRWYNASRKYWRTNITYEAPFLFMPYLLKHVRNVLNERLYIGVLGMPHLNPYVEVGYGIGTHMFDMGIFLGNYNGKFSGVGFKFTLELFNR